MERTVYEDFRWLLGDSAQTLLVAAQEAFVDQVNAISIAKRLRKQTTAARAAMVMEQAQLRIRGREKFAFADQMYFTRRGFEQATGAELAVYKASRFADCDRVADICCGLGGDLIALASRPGSSGSSSESTTVGVDSDDVTALFAARNLEVHLNGQQDSGIQQAKGRKNWVQRTTFEKLNLSEFDGLHLDPDRRTERRTVHGNRFSPSLEEVYTITCPKQMISIKVAPATPVDDYFPQQLYREWIGDRRECKQQLLWSGGECARLCEMFGSRTATVVLGDQVHQFSVREDQVDVRAGVVEQAQKYLYEPHATVLAARLTDAMAVQYGARRSASDIPYLFSEEPIEHPLLSGFRVVSVMPMDMKVIMKSLNKYDLGRLEIKRRGIDNITAAKFAKFKTKGSISATLILARVGKQDKRKAILAKRISKAKVSGS